MFSNQLLRPGLILFLSVLSIYKVDAQAAAYKTQKGLIEFTSDASLEQISAKSSVLRGILDPEKRAFAFSVPVTSFQGFNSALQREHFNENYLESDQYPEATFTGKIIEQIDFLLPGDYTIRAKGKLTIHGIVSERIIKSTVKVNNNEIRITSDFSVLLVDHGIQIPRVVNQKIAEEINVHVSMTLKK